MPADSEAAQRLSAPNYDEFQSNDEIRELIRNQPNSVLRVTMAHCDPEAGPEVAADSPAALARASANMRDFMEGDSTRIVKNVLYVYSIEDPTRRGVVQIGLGGMAQIAEIRTESSPDGPIIRNEGIREAKARGRARLIEATSSFIGTVNHAIQDATGSITQALEDYAGGRPADFSARDEHGNRHHVWLVVEPSKCDRFAELLAQEAEAYVADGNHRSSAAAMLGSEHFLAVFFPMSRMSLAPYNRLVRDVGVATAEMLNGLAERFQVDAGQDVAAFQPTRTHEIGLYTEGVWYRLAPEVAAYDSGNAVEVIDADIVQRSFFAAVLGITDPRDERLTFVGGDRDVQYLKAKVDEGEYRYAVTLPAVTMEQFVEVCRQNRIMPPKSTWFQPKIRSGLVMALVV